MVALLLPRVISLLFVAAEASIAAWIAANGQDLFSPKTEGNKPEEDK